MWGGTRRLRSDSDAATVVGAVTAMSIKTVTLAIVMATATATAMTAMGLKPGDRHVLRLHGA